MVELIISMVLLGLISVVMAGSLRFGARVWDAGAERGEWINRTEITQNFLRQHIGQASASRPADEAADEEDAFADEMEQTFSGAPNRLRFVAPGPAQAGVAGFSRFELFVSEEGEEADLVLSIGLGEAAETGAADVDSSDARVLIEDIEAAAFRYFGAIEEGREPDWHDEWTDPGRVPSLVALQVSFPEGDRRVWPELVIAPRLGAASAREPG